MNRRDFLFKTGAVASLSVFAKNALLAQPTVTGPSSAGPQPLPNSGGTGGPPIQAPTLVTEFHPLRRNVGYFTGRGGTIGWLSSSSSLVAVDTQFPDTAAIFLKGMPGRNERTLDAVINTHHHGDHTGGNGVFKPVTKTIVAQANVPELMINAAKRSPLPTTPVVPNETFPETWRHDFGDETISARYFRPAHTSGDIVVHFENANVVHTGDLVFNRIYPVIDRSAGGRFKTWLTTTEDIVKNYPADATYIFGHGSQKFGVTGGHADILAFRDYIAALLAYVEKEIKGGKTKDEISKLDNLPDFPDLHVPPGPGNRLPGNLGAAYDEPGRELNGFSLSGKIRGDCCQLQKKKLTVSDKLADKPVDVLTRNLSFNFTAQAMYFLGQPHGDAHFVGQFNDGLGLSHFPTPAGQTHTDWLR